MILHSITVGAGTVVDVEQVTDDDGSRVVVRLGPHLTLYVDELVADELADALIEASIAAGAGE
jgi:2-keto-3-deoxy-6-phosphogluconate aldolase